jgi:hypothetical protein
MEPTDQSLTLAAPMMYEACKAAVRYFEAISGRAADQEYEPREWGAITTGQDLDDLFNDWMRKAFCGIAQAERKK